MKKILIFSIIFALFTMCASSLVYATGIDMNLTTNGTTPSEGTPNTDVNANTIADTNTVGTEAQGELDNTGAGLPQTTPTPDTPVSVGSTSALSEPSLTLSNILNIILIVLGILLVLFAIAILIRMR